MKDVGFRRKRCVLEATCDRIKDSPAKSPALLPSYVSAYECFIESKRHAKALRSRILRESLDRDCLWHCFVRGLAEFWARRRREAFFENRIRPLLIEKCSRCHGDGKSAGGLRLVDRESILRGGEGGAILVPGKPLESRLDECRTAGWGRIPDASGSGQSIVSTRGQGSRNVDWFGAYWPEHAVALSGRRSWAWQPLQVLPAPTQLPNVSIVNDIDAWIVASQRELGQQRTPEAEKRILLRRIHYDLTGLPPSPEEIESFLTDSRPQAYADRVDRLLHSRAYGEKWGRHWLDVVRYADTAGETADYPAPLAWRYRDYVIDAFQNDKPWIDSSWSKLQETFWVK